MPVLSWLLSLSLLASLAIAGPVEDAESLLRDERPGAAMAALTQHLAASPDDVAAHELLIDIQLNSNLAEIARKTYLDRAQETPQDADAWYLLGRAALDPGESMRAYQQAIDLDATHARALTGQAAMYRVAGRTDQAVSLYVEALAHDDKLLEAWSGLWSTQLLSEDPRSAALTAERASEAIPDTPEPWLTLALLRPDRARTYLSQGLAQNPGDYRLVVDNARHLFKEQDLEAAQKAYRSALRVAPEDPTVRTESAMLSEIASDMLSWAGAQALLDTRSQSGADALRQVDGVVAQNPRSSLARVIRGNLKQQQSDLSGAATDLRAAVELTPTSAEANAALGLLLLQQKQAPAAVAPLKVAYESRGEDVALGLAYAVALAEGSDPGAGGIVLLELEERFPYEAGPPMALAQLLMNLGEPGRAYAVLLEATKRMPEPQLVLAMAAMAQAAGRPAEAAEALTELGRRTGDPRFDQAARQLLGSVQE